MDLKSLDGLTPKRPIPIQLGASHPKTPSTK
ncbi:Putative protein [Zobellia galactanivorans]|uniref:Uncharacterized protein n=1 Tax=Zobellia galactanivorans (strain DSM 12802 / CCUG 47099 / CIP 106680 / NCIMB 13871 / Dsij) TaxID=63186 RepID=G0LC94_ZOBGA|nr:Putative protein [Zobellia galactanivorans]